MQTISLDTVGARIYFRGNTYPIKDRVKALGAHWDGDQRAWWIGAAKRAAAEALVTGCASTATTGGDDRTPDRNARVRARVRYKGKDYYLLAEGGGRLLLAARNGTFQFWAAREAAQITKQYGRENYRTGRTEYPRLGTMIERAEAWKSMSREDRARALEDAEARRTGDRCPCSGGACRCGSDSPCCMCG